VLFTLILILSMEVKVQSESGHEYTVDTEELTCTCPNFRFSRRHYTKSHPERMCKHIRQVFDEHPELMPSDIRRQEVEAEQKSQDSSLGEGYPRVLFDGDYGLFRRLFDELGWKWSVTGAYRRNALRIPELEILIAKEDFKLESIQQQIEFAMGAVVTVEEDTIEIVMNLFRHIKLFLVPKDEFATRLFFTTGPKEEVLRLIKTAEDKGLILNQQDLFGLDGEPLNIKDESEIYEQLGLPFINEWNR